ncbi:MAG: hypothetical protein ACE5J5_00295 [Candidatus Hydrothermarchaeales archaeon]
MRILRIITSIPILAMGIGLIYFGYLEPSPLFLFIYLSLGLAMIVIGTQLFISGIKNGEMIYEKKSDLHKLEESTIEDTHVNGGAPEREPEKCPNCGAEITTAGKFCGSCGKVF